jgi:DMSO/TMAO reductase YedYZ molybdopterin-dependent catalytic subunit
LTPESWHLEITAEDKATVEKPLTIDRGNALRFDALIALGRTRGVFFLKAMQCNNISLPLGQGLWEGVPLREVLALCGAIHDARRVYYWGFHNNDPKQMFRSSLAMNQALDTPPGDLPPFLAYRLNGGPIPLERGGPVRMVVPWAHGFKSVKWLQRIVLTNTYEANDTYALANNDPESYLKTAAYFDDPEPQSLPANTQSTIRGTAMVGWPGLERVECWLRSAATPRSELAEGDPLWKSADWRPCTIDPPPSDWAGSLPEGVHPSRIAGFSPDGQPNTWPMRFSVAHWTFSLPRLGPGTYELRVRTVDRNGFAQPQPRTSQRSGRNAVQCLVLQIS